MKENIYQQITNRILEQLNNGIIPWQKPWVNIQGSAACYNIASGKAYSFLNQMLLDRPGGYMTYKQAHEKGYTIKKGAKASVVTFWKMMQYEDEERMTDGTIKKRIRNIPYLQKYPVFHETDIEGLKVERKEENDGLFDGLRWDDKAEAIINNYVERERLNFTACKSNNAYYQPNSDCVVVPMISQYEDEGEYYSTTFHELTHSTGAAHRLDRGVNKISAFGSCDYSKEELVAEIGAAMLVGFCDFDPSKCFKNSVAYIHIWAKRIEADNKLIVSAASKAEKAAKYILSGEKSKD